MDVARAREDAVVSSSFKHIDDNQSVDNTSAFATGMGWVTLAGLVAAVAGFVVYARRRMTVPEFHLAPNTPPRRRRL